MTIEIIKVRDLVEVTIYAITCPSQPEGYAFTSFVGDHSYMTLTGYVEVWKGKLTSVPSSTDIRNGLLDGLTDKARKIQADAQLALHVLEDERAALLSIAFQEEKEL